VRFLGFCERFADNGGWVLKLQTWSLIKSQLEQCERQSTRCRARNHEGYSSLVGNRAYIHANGRTRDCRQEGCKSVGSGFAMVVRTSPALHCVVQCRPSLHPVFLSTDKQQAGVHCLFVVRAKLSWPHDDDTEAITTVERLLMGP
jgi:hypothetical protein